MSDERRVSEPLLGNPVGPWHRWFAWRPVQTVDRGWRWLVPVWRRRYQSKFSLPGPIDTWFGFQVEEPS